MNYHAVPQAQWSQAYELYFSYDQSEQPHVNLASSSSPFNFVHGLPEPMRYLDNGAINHVIAQLKNLNVRSNYKGKKGKLALCNEFLLSISQLGLANSQASKLPQSAPQVLFEIVK